MQRYSIVIHGGAGTLLRDEMAKEEEAEYKNSLNEAVSIGYGVLDKRGAAIDAVEKAVESLENCPLFNAGKGSVFTHSGTHEMEASIMNGADLKVGSVALLSGIKNPILLARDVMDRTNNVFLAGKGAIEFAKELGYTLEPKEYFYNDYRYKQWVALKDTDDFQLDHSSKQDSKFGTVGAVACDQFGNVAAATSTGGLTNKRNGRLGDTPIVGAGTYANNKTCAVSCTGNGEYFIRGMIAHMVSCLVEFKKLSIDKAVREVVYNYLAVIKGEGGLIAVDANGMIAFDFNTDGMYRAYKSSKPFNNFPAENVLIFRD